MVKQSKLKSYSCEPNFTGYPLFYVVNQTALCASCAQKEKDSGENVEMQCNWEDHNLYCDACSEKLESAYKDEELNSQASKPMENI
jgi:hypothetical protein|tara:strand:+ start:609 stop:866 length:258 start_codon:yes stop_codon:yes gene_type:complete